MLLVLVFGGDGVERGGSGGGKSGGGGGGCKCASGGGGADNELGIDKGIAMFGVAVIVSVVVRLVVTR